MQSVYPPKEVLLDASTTSNVPFFPLMFWYSSGFGMRAHMCDGGLLILRYEI